MRISWKKYVWESYSLFVELNVGWTTPYGANNIRDKILHAVDNCQF